MGSLQKIVHPLLLLLIATFVDFGALDIAKEDSDSELVRLVIGADLNQSDDDGDTNDFDLCSSDLCLWEATFPGSCLSNILTFPAIPKLQSCHSIRAPPTLV
ncbi:MAG: hypothetical protein HQ498_09795 [Pseudohongiella sp.]|nr:hypothetical protein [Pseudohongiella sp.]